ncbi:MAG: hypothetical protein AAF528_09520 [Cyanobacteria bacterium P01_C01_bin.121]
MGIVYLLRKGYALGFATPLGYGSAQPPGVIGNRTLSGVVREAFT